MEVAQGSDRGFTISWSNGSWVATITRDGPSKGTSITMFESQLLDENWQVIARERKYNYTYDQITETQRSQATIDLLEFQVTKLLA